MPAQSRLHRLRGVAHLGADREVTVAGKRPPQVVASRCVIVGDKDAQPLRSGRRIQIATSTGYAKCSSGTIIGASVTTPDNSATTATSPRGRPIETV
jgi:hypothetical protein